MSEHSPAQTPCTSCGGDFMNHTIILITIEPFERTCGLHALMAFLNPIIYATPSDHIKSKLVGGKSIATISPDMVAISARQLPCIALSWSFARKGVFFWLSTAVILYDVRHARSIVWSPCCIPYQAFQTYQKARLSFGIPSLLIPDRPVPDAVRLRKFQIIRFSYLPYKKLTGYTRALHWLCETLHWILKIFFYVPVKRFGNIIFYTNAPFI